MNCPNWFTSLRFFRITIRSALFVTELWKCVDFVDMHVCEVGKPRESQAM